MLSIDEHMHNFMFRKKVKRPILPSTEVIEYIDKDTRTRLPAVDCSSYSGVDMSKLGGYDNANAFVNRHRLIALERVE